MDEQTATDNPSAELTSPTVPDPDQILLLIDEAERALGNLRQALIGGELPSRRSAVRQKAASLTSLTDEEGARIIEGVFDGQNMVGPDGKQYSVPANYASKSKLVEGDVLKLTITRDGSFIYKQIGPVDRQRLIGKLVRDTTTGEYKVLAGGRTLKVLLASVTYFKGDADDEVVVLVPTEGESRWGAVENIIKTTAESGQLAEVSAE